MTSRSIIIHPDPVVNYLFTKMQQYYALLDCVQFVFVCSYLFYLALNWKC
ncbi:hypothetical protein VCHA35O135_10039 [Vibrio chagasii]|nr:hypothetical protein VCHA35O135_10039 [Vibrio chagasii]